MNILQKLNEMRLHAFPNLVFGKSCSVTQDKKSISFAIKREVTKISIKNTKKFVDKPNDEIILTSTDPLEPGRVDLKIGWKSEISKDNFGIFTVNNAVYTHFEPAFARNAFPCVDTFAAKASFEVTLVTPESEHIFVSNMPIKSQSRKKINTIVFEKTPILSPYLVAFAFGDFKQIAIDSFESTNQDTLPLSIYVPNSTLTYPSQLIMETIQKSLKLLESEFQVSIFETGLKKLDVIIVPNLCFGGMENHGCIFFNETASQFKKSEQDGFVELVVHEVAHQWIGNYVSCDMWIKEGLAQYYEKTITDMVLKRKPHVFAKREEKDIPKNDKSTSSKEDYQTYNGVNYTKSMNFIVEKIVKMGTENWKSIMRQILQEYPFGYLDEKEFIKRLAV